MQIGERVLGRFQLETEAGAGAMGVVFRARDLMTGRFVALKSLRSPDPDSAQRFAREGDVLAALRHPAVVEYVAHGQSSTGEPFLAMEWLEGASLKQVLDERTLSFVEIIDVAMAIAGALVPAHAQGIIHRDLKPANVFLVGRSAASVKVLDFGIARLRGAGTITGTGNMLGTPAYMSPEQVSGARAVDGRSDLFSIGAILFACIAGKTPFASDEPLAILLAVTTQRAPSISSVAPETPPKLAAIVDALLQSAPSDRPADATTALRALAAARAEAIALNAGAPSARRASVTHSGPPSWTTPNPTSYVNPTLTGQTVSDTGSATGRTAATGTVSKPSRSYLGFGLALAGVLVVGGGAIGGYLAFSSSDTSSKSRSKKHAVTNDDSPPPAPSPSSTGYPWCSAMALNCTLLDMPDKRHAEADKLVAIAIEKTHAARPTAKLTGISGNGLTDQGIDFESGGLLSMTFTHGVGAVVNGDHLIVFQAGEDSEHPMPPCSLGEGYQRARKAGLRGSPSATFTLANSGVMFIVDHSHTVILDPKTCDVQSAIDP